MKNFSAKNERGFTLIETFVAITILLIAVLGPLGVLSKSISDGLYARNEIAAYYLAQEGVEQVVSFQKNRVNQAGKPGWLGDLSPGCNGQGNLGCSFAENGDLIICGNNPSDCQLVQDQSGRYIPLEDRDPVGLIYTRFITVEPNPANTEAKITATVTWLNGRLGQRTFTLSSYISNYLTF